MKFNDVDDLQYRMHNLVLNSTSVYIVQYSPRQPWHLNFDYIIGYRERERQKRR